VPELSLLLGEVCREDEAGSKGAERGGVRSDCEDGSGFFGDGANRGDERVGSERGAKSEYRRLV